jgi:uncharacterized membrane protein YvlD (DUF360 family)
LLADVAPFHHGSGMGGGAGNRFLSSPQTIGQKDQTPRTKRSPLMSAGDSCDCASIYLILSGHWTKGILLALWGALVISTIDNFLRPKLVKNQTKLHELFVFFSVLGGMSVFGLLGIVLGPVVLAITLGLLDTFKLESSAAPT